MCGCPQFHVSLKVGLMLITGHVSLRQEGQGIVNPSQLSSLTYLSLVGLIGTLDDSLPDVSGERLVRICFARQLAAFPFIYYFLISVDSVIYVPLAIRQGLIGLFNLVRPSVGSIVDVATQLSKPL